MPITNGVYTAPTFVNNSTPALDADEMNAMARAVAGAVEFDRAQALTSAQKQQALTNIGGLSTGTQTLSAAQKQQVNANIGAVSVAAQTLTTAQQQQVAQNIGAVSVNQQTLTTTQQQQARDNLNCAAKSQTALVTVPTSAWSGADAPYTANVSCDIVEAGSKIIVQPGGTPTAEQYEAIASSGIFCTGQGSGTITLSAYGGIPAVDIQVAVILVG